MKGLWWFITRPNLCSLGVLEWYNKMKVIKFIDYLKHSFIITHKKTSTIKWHWKLRSLKIKMFKNAIYLLNKKTQNKTRNNLNYKNYF